MALFQPRRNNSEESEAAGVERQFATELEILKKTGVIKSIDTIEGKFIEKMQYCGLDADSLLSRLSSLTECDNPSVQLSAIKTGLSLYMHPAMVSNKNQATEKGGNVTFVINSPNVNMQNVLTPNSNKDEDSGND